MNLRFKKSFSKSYKKLSSSDKERVDIAMLSFQQDPFQKELSNHALKGSMQGLHAFSAGFDLRVIYREEGDHAVVYLLKTGSHNQVY
jgi:addiction module RelE/StbE family toxin